MEAAHESDPGPVCWSDEWTIHSDETGLQLIAGADRQIALGGISPELEASVATWSKGEVRPTTDDEAMLIDQLTAMGVLVPGVADPVNVIGSGPLAEELSKRLEAAGCTSTDGSTGLEVLIRSAQGWPEPSQGATHLAVNNRLHHTVVLGPLVVPGISACTDCLDHRSEYRWPAKPEPAVPAATRFPYLAAELVLIQVGLAKEGRSPLVNATIAWDLETGSAKHETLLKLPGCPKCDTIGSTGQIRLP